MKRILFMAGALLASEAWAVTIPSQDSRNTDTPGTDTHMALPAWQDRVAWEKRKIQLRRQILFAAGLDPMPARTPLHPQVFGRIETRDCTIEKVLIETLPGYYLGGNLYRPLHAAGKLPAVLNPHGHWTYGRLENQPLYSGPQLGANLARQGYVVFAWDMVGYNDTIQTPHAFGSPTEQLWSFGPLGLQLWNSIRAVDFIASLDDVDPDQIAITGASGGATQTILLAAVDDRIRYAAPVNMVSAIMQGGDFCENAPGLRRGTNNVEIAAMIAPRPLLLVSATGDWTRNTPTEEFPAIRRIYELYGKPENVETLQLDAPHNFNKENREAVYRFFGKHILHRATEVNFSEKASEVQMLQSMLALSGRGLPPGAVSYDQLFGEWKRTAEGSRDRLSVALGSEWPENVVDETHGESVVLSRPAVGDRIPGLWTDGKGTPALVIGPTGAAGARDDASVRQIRLAGRPVLLIDVFQTGTTVAPRDRSQRHFLTFNQSDDACRVQDILTALAWIHQKHPGPIELIGLGAAGVWTEFAAAVAPIPLKLRYDRTAFRGRDEDFLKQFNVPGIQRAGGLAEAERLTEKLK